MAELTVTGLRVLREVAARGSFTAAAEALGYTQSAVSRQVAAMEVAAGAPLFVRTRRGVTPTDAGAVLLRRGVEVLEGLAAAERELAGVRAGATGRVRLGAFSTAMAALVPAAIAALAAQRPGVEVRLREGSSVAHLGRVARGALDLAVVGPAEAPDGVTLEPLLDDPLLVAVGRAHPLALAAGAAELDALRDEPWIAAHTDVSATLLAGVRWVPRIAYAVADWNAKLGLVAAGLGITLVPGLAARGVRDDVTLVPLRGCTRPVFLAQPAGAPASPQAQALAAELRAAAR